MQTGHLSTIGALRIFTVGHSNHDSEAFLSLLKSVAIAAIADVRSQPYSGRFPQFNREPLEAFLHSHGIEYVFLGDLLGGRPENPDLYDEENRVDYRRVQRTELFRRGIVRLLGLAQRHAVAMLCAEADPLTCHRGLMITPELKERGIDVRHLRKDGSIETTDEMEARLLELTNAAPLDGLFASLVTDEENEAALRFAYRTMSARKAFRHSED